MTATFHHHHRLADALLVPLTPLAALACLTAVLLESPFHRRWLAVLTVLAMLWILAR